MPVRASGTTTLVSCWERVQPSISLASIRDAGMSARNECTIQTTSGKWKPT